MGGGQQATRIPELLTCVSKDQDDLTSQIRLTFNRYRGASTPQNMATMGFDDDYFDDDYFDDDEFDDDYFDDDDFDDDDYFFGGMPGMPEDSDDVEYRIDGAFVPGHGHNKAGSYQMVITKYGRTADGCNAEALGPILTHEMLGKQSRQLSSRGRGMMGGGHMMRGHMMGGYGMMNKGISPMFGVGFGNPMMGGFPGPYQKFGANFWQGGQSGYGGQMGQMGGMGQKPIGFLSNTAIVGGSASVYSTHVEGITKTDLLGRGVALCQRVEGGRCVGRIPYCCTVQRDRVPAMEVFVEHVDDDHFDDMHVGIHGGMHGGMHGGNRGGMGGGMGGGMMAGVAGVSGVAGIGAVGGVGGFHGDMQQGNMRGPMTGASGGNPGALFP